MGKRHKDRTKGTDLPPLVLRLALGPTMFAHGYNKVFGQGGLEGTERWFHSSGFRPAAVHARVAAATEMTAGALMTVGALNPMPSAGIVGVMTVAALTEHKEHGFFVFKNGWEYTAVIGATAVALAGAGYGRWSLDHLVGRNRKGWRPALLAAALGVANAALVLKTSYQPEADEEPAEASSEDVSANGKAGTGSAADGEVAPADA